MRRARGVLALPGSVLLGLVLVAAAQPGAGHAPPLPKRWSAAAQAGAGHAPLLPKRWSAAAQSASARVHAPFLPKRWG